MASAWTNQPLHINTSLRYLALAAFCHMPFRRLRHAPVKCATIDAARVGRRTAARPSGVSTAGGAAGIQWGSRFSREPARATEPRANPETSPLYGIEQNAHGLPRRDGAPLRLAVPPPAKGPGCAKAVPGDTLPQFGQSGKEVIEHGSARLSSRARIEARALAWNAPSPCLR